jgi:hypothetical protein
VRLDARRKKAGLEFLETLAHVLENIEAAPESLSCPERYASGVAAPLRIMLNRGN